LQSPSSREGATCKSSSELDLEFLRGHKYIQGFAIYGKLIVLRYSHTIFVFREPSEYIALKKQERIRNEVKYVDENEVDDLSYPIATFQPNEAGWNYALGFIRQFGGDGPQMVFLKEILK